MLGKKHNSNTIFNKFTKNISFEKLTRTPSPQAAEETQTPSRQNKIRSHNNPNDKIIPTRRSLGTIPQLTSDAESDSGPYRSSQQGGQEMKDVAFEVVFDKDNTTSQNVHPLDEPLVLRNGKKIFPTTTPPARMNRVNSNSSINQDIKNISINDLITTCEKFYKFTFSMLVKFWQLDSHMNISITENTTLKLHLPSVVFFLVFVKLFFSLTSSNRHDSFSMMPSPTPNSSSGSGILPLLILVLVGVYWYHHLSTNEVGAARDETPFASPNSQLVFNDDAQTLVGSVEGKENELWENEPQQSQVDHEVNTPPLTRKNSLTTKLETMIHRNNLPVEKSSVKIIHRKEERQKHPKTKLHLNLPIDHKRKIDTPSTEFQDMTRLRREEMLNAFNS